VLVGPRDAPFGRFAVAADPQGATFSLYEGSVDD
jgi:predicted enzyme related to lactoylglutathione lyase